jgi:hypothetical protein
MNSVPRGGFEAPGERLTLDVALHFTTDVAHATIGVVVWDLTRELYVYGASSDALGMPSESEQLFAGGRLSIEENRAVHRGDQLQRVEHGLHLRAPADDVSKWHRLAGTGSRRGGDSALHQPRCRRTARSQRERLGEEIDGAPLDRRHRLHDPPVPVMMMQRISGHRESAASSTTMPSASGSTRSRTRAS